MTLLAGRYEVGRLLGRGGMAVVHLGQDTRLHRQVAIKMLRLDLADDPTAQTRFRREAQSAAGLNHPSIVAVFDTGEDDFNPAPGGGPGHRVPFIVMEYVQGMTLRELLRDSSRKHATDTIALPPSSQPQNTDERDRGTPLPVDQAVAITSHVLAALAYSHSMGIVHRDIKPGNVMLTPSGAVKVMDFGIARAIADASATMTSTQTVVGTAQYLSPEQATGEQVDARSDLYSTGCLLYELLTGRPPFVGDNPVAVAYQHVREQPNPPSHYNPAVGNEVDRVVMHALTKNRDERYQTAQAFNNDLLNALDGRPVDAPPTEAIRRAPAAAVVTPKPAPAAESITVVEELDTEQPSRSRGWSWALMLLALVAMAIAGWFLADRFFGTKADPMVAVPAVLNLSAEQAKVQLEKAGLKYDEGTGENSDSVPEGSVVSQNPEAATQVAAGSTVTVRLSLGSENVAVPDLTNKTQQEAQDLLTKQGLRVGTFTTEDSKDVAKDSVVKTDPVAGSTVARNSPVNLVISTGRVTVPDFTNRPVSVARQELRDLGLEVKVEYETTSSVAAGSVIRQSPGAGSVEQGSSVTLVVAQAPVVTYTPTIPPSTPATTPSTTPTESPTQTTSPSTEPSEAEDPPTP